MMINETVILLSRLEDCSEQRLAKHITLAHEHRFDLNFYKPLQKVFSKVIPYDYFKRLTEIGYKGINEEVIALVRKEHPKYVFCLALEYEFQPSTFDVIRKEGSAVIGFFFDDEWRFDNYCKWWIPHLDYCITLDPEAIPKYEALGAQAIHTFPCEGIPVNRNWPNMEEKYDVSFIGNVSYRPSRKQYVDALKNRNIPVRVFDRGLGGYVPYSDMLDIFWASKINLHFSEARETGRMGFKGRIPLICLNGGFLLTEYVPGIEHYFRIDKEIVCFKNAEEMIDKVIYYLNHDEERRAIAQAGWKRAINEYTPFHLLSKIFDQIEKDIAAKDKEGPTRPQELKMPRRVRKIVSNYYFLWGGSFLEENYKGLWKDALALSLSYNPFNIGARYYYIVGFFPPFTRPTLFLLYRAMKKVRRGLFSWADSVPYLREMKRSIAKRLYYT